MSYIIRKKRHVWTQSWDRTRFSQALQPGTQAVLVDRFANKGRIGVLTDIGVLWVPAGVNGDLFYYNWVEDGDLVEKVLRVIGGGSSQSSTTGVPSPMHLDPPHTFQHRLTITCVNNDTISHQGEVYAQGYDIFRYPDED